MSNPTIWLDSEQTQPYTGTEITAVTGGVDVVANDASLIGTTQVVYIAGDVSDMYG